MAKSSLATVTKSDSSYSSRTANTVIDTITLHCLTNRNTCEQLYTYYSSNNRSSHYVIDVNGAIWSLVDEKYAANCTDNASINNRSISITIAADRLAPFEISNKAILSLQNLLVELCTRHEDNLLKLVWNSSSVYRASRHNGSNINFFSDFTDANCKDTSLVSITPEVVTRVNSQLIKDRLEEEDEEAAADVPPAQTSGNATVNTASMVSKEDVVSSTNYLSESSMQINARYIWQYLGSKEWTLNAVAGLLGNMQCESTLNPGLGEFGGSGFGLVQWTPKSKFTNWLHTNLPGVPDDDIDGQLARIVYEAENNLQYSKTSDYNYDFSTYIKSDETPYNLACAFVFNYERPGVVCWGFHTNSWDRKSVYCSKTASSSCVGNCVACLPCYKAAFGETATAAMAEINRENLRKRRGGCAEEWYTFLLPYSNLTPPSVYGLQITEIGADFVEAKCYLSEMATGLKLRLNVLDNKDKVIEKADVEVEAKAEEAIFRVEKLKPDTEYFLQLAINPSEEESETESDTDSEEEKESKPCLITFKTTDGRPESVDGVHLTSLNLPLPDHEFEVTFDPPESWGYWVEKSSLTLHGYVVEIIINGKVEKSYPLVIPDGTFKITPADINSLLDIKVKPGDTLQVGLRTWAVNSKGKELFDEAYSKTSNPILLVVNNHKVFLPKEKYKV